MLRTTYLPVPAYHLRYYCPALLVAWSVAAKEVSRDVMRYIGLNSESYIQPMWDVLAVAGYFILYELLK